MTVAAQHSATRLQAGTDGCRSSRLLSLGETGAATASAKSRIRRRERRGGPAQRRHCDSPARTGARTKAVVPSPDPTRSDLGETERPPVGAPAHAFVAKHKPGPSSQRPVLNRWNPRGPQAGAMRSTACRAIDGFHHEQALDRVARCRVGASRTAGFWLTLVARPVGRAAQTRPRSTVDSGPALSANQGSHEPNARALLRWRTLRLLALAR
jgi:hypothetical protein